MKKRKYLSTFILLAGFICLLSGCGKDDMTVLDRNGNPVVVDTASQDNYSFFPPNSKPAAESSGTGWDCPFIDVEENDWFYNAVRENYINGLMRGTSEITFSPDDPVSRGMVAATLWRMENTPLAEESTFIDVPADQYYAQAVAWASSVYVVDGFDTEHFAPDGPITREQLAAVLYRYAAYKGYDTSTQAPLNNFADQDTISDYAKPAIAWAVGESYMSGMEDGTLQPKGVASRAQFASLLRHFYR